MTDSQAGLLDCLIVGAGPAGLTAATYLARFRRRILMIDAGSSRARWIPASHNCPGFPFGVAGNDLLGRYRQHALGFGVPIHDGLVERVDRIKGGFVAAWGNGSCTARSVVLATGVVDQLPDVPGIEDAIKTGVVRLCAVCDGYEATDQAIALWGPAAQALDHAVFLRTYSCHLTVIATDGRVSPEISARAQAHGIVCIHPTGKVQFSDTSCQFIDDNGNTHQFDTVYPVLGARAQSDLATNLHASTDHSGALITDRCMQTSVPGLYAIGDVVSGLNQISVAVGHAALAAMAIHRDLPLRARETMR